MGRRDAGTNWYDWRIEKKSENCLYKIHDIPFWGILRTLIKQKRLVVSVSWRGCVKEKLASSFDYFFRNEKPIAVFYTENCCEKSVYEWDFAWSGMGLKWAYQYNKPSYTWGITLKYKVNL